MSGPRRGTRGLARWLIRCASVCFVSLSIGQAAHGQAFALTGGSSSIFDANGGSFEMRTLNYTGRIDLGYMNGLSLGFSMLHLYRGALLDAGDQQIPLVFPTDIFNPSYYFFGRGLSVLRKNKNRNTRLFVFVGATSTAYWAPFLNTARTSSLVGAIFYERQISPSLRWFSRNVFGSRQTSVQSVEWAARKDIKMAFSGGVGNNEAYEASSFSWSDPRISVDASYTLAGNNFQRVEVTAPQLTESDRENIRVEYAPISQVRIVASRNNYLAPPGEGLAARAAVNGFGMWTGFSGNQFYGSFYQSSTSSFGQSEVYALGAHRDFTRRLGVGADYLGTLSAGRGSHTIVGNIRETLSSRLSVNQIITHGNGQTQVAFGGDFISNFATLSVDYQTVFLPFVQAGPNQLKQFIVVSLHFQLPHGVQFNAETNVTPFGKLGYTAYASTYTYHGMGPVSPGTSFSGAFFHNAVRGQVLDAQGKPIEGAALRIGPDLAVTDSDGNFIVRMKKAGELNLKVAFDEFTVPGNYVVVQAPATVRAAREDSAEAYTIVLRRVRNTLSTADPSAQPDSQDHPPKLD